jgi:probable HAF family extracellular repeat protein
MSRIRFGVWAAMVLMLVPLAGAQSYTITDIGTIGGSLLFSLAVNDSGAVTGTAAGKDGLVFAFLWTAAKGRLDLGTLPGDNDSYGSGINDAGEVVGTSVNLDTGSHAFLWTPSSGMQDLGSLGGYNSRAVAINNSSEVVGWSYLADNVTYHAFLWTKAGGMQDLGTLDGSNSGATAINDSGDVVGSSGDAFLWTQAGGMQDLGALSAGYSSYAEAINASGEAFGASTYEGGGPTNSAVSWTQNGGISPLYAGFNSVALGANNSGEVVGFTGGTETAFLWTPAQHTQNLNRLIPADSGWVLYQAWSINSTGQIAAVGTFSHYIHAALLTPTN